MSLDVHMAPAVIAPQGTGGRSSSSTSVPTVKPTSAAPVNNDGSPTQGAGDPSAEKLAATVSQLNKHTQQVQRDLKFVIDEQSGSVVIQIVDTQSKHVIRQIPPKDIMALRHHLEELSSLLFHGKA